MTAAIAESAEYTIDYWRIGSALTCATASTEMALSAIRNLREMSMGGAHPNTRKNLKSNLTGAVFYGLAAMNVIAGTAKIGAILFSLYAADSFHLEDSYFTVKLIGPYMAKAVKHLSTLIVNVGKVAFGILKRISQLNHPIWFSATLIMIGISVYCIALPTILGNERERESQPLLK